MTDKDEVSGEEELAAAAEVENEDAEDGFDDEADIEDDEAEELLDEGDIAADYIEELLDAANIAGDFYIETLGNRSHLTVTAPEGSNLSKLASPDTVAALQELARLAVQARTGERSGLILDIGGSRNARAQELSRLVEHAIERIEGGATSASLPPMSSYERKLVHDLVAAHDGYVSESMGEGRDRHTVISRA